MHQALEPDLIKNQRSNRFTRTASPAQAIVDGVLRKAPLRAEHKEFSLDGVPYEAINNSGGLCTVLDLLASGKLPIRGFVRQEDITLSDFLANRFGAVYADGPMALAPAALPWGDTRQPHNLSREDFKDLMPLAHV